MTGPGRRQRGRGRPSLTGARRPSPRLTVRLPDELLRRAERAAKQRRTTVSELAREILERSLTNADAERLLARASLLATPPPPVRFAEDPTRRLRALDRMRAEQAALKRAARIG